MSDDFYLADVDELAARVPDGARVAWPVDSAGNSAALARALVRRGVRDLRLVNVPTGAYATDLLIGAGCVAEIETSGVSLDEYGPAPRFGKAVKEGLVRIRDATCPAIHAELQAGEKGVPFVPLRGLIGTDVLANRPDWRVIDNPLGGGGDPIVLLPALVPDFLVFHGAIGDPDGNVWVGRRGDLKTASHAARASLVTVERRVDFDLLSDERYAAGTVPALYVEGMAVAERGTWPCVFWDGQAADDDHMRLYAGLARSDDGFAEYLERFVFERRAAA